MKFLNYGSLNIDYVYRVDHILAPGETLSSKGREIFPGGKGLNQSIALARAGVEVFHAGRIGKEGGFLLDLCRENGICTDFIKLDENADCGHTMIQVDANGENAILLYGGSNQQQEKAQMDEVLDHFGRGDVILLQNEINEMPYLIDRAYEKGLTIFLNPSPMDEKLLRCDLEKISWFLLNEVEAEQLTGTKDEEEIRIELRKRYPGAKFVLTLGKEGACYFDAEESVFQESFPVKVVDTTAAGDTFTGYFIAELLKGGTKEEALRIASRAASIAVSRKGASTSIPYRKELDA
ncbi:MAG: ribokinase [Ruminococcus sp.]|nr:ribokinase [Ruminococcus sp.]